MTKWGLFFAILIASKVFTLSGIEQNSVAIASDGSGNFYALWGSLNSSGNEVIQTATFTAGGSWSTPPTSLSASNHIAICPKIAVASNGAAVAVWYNIDATGTASIRGAFLPSGSTTWSSTQQISLATDNPPLEDSLNVSIGISGTIITTTTATAVWKLINNSNNEVAKASQTTTGTSWTTPVKISTIPP